MTKETCYILACCILADILASFLGSEGELDGFLNCTNSLCNNVKFTLETETNHTIFFFRFNN